VLAPVSFLNAAARQQQAGLAQCQSKLNAVVIAQQLSHRARREAIDAAMLCEPVIQSFAARVKEVQ
jgi:predicted metal-dependent HD superfamily phosphohydrolase